MLKAFMFTDLHYTPDLVVGARNCGASLRKAEALQNEISAADLRIHLGDLINGTGNEENDLAAMKTVKGRLDQLQFHHVMGNHDAFALDKDVVAPCRKDLGMVNTFTVDTGEGTVDFITLDGCFYEDQTGYTPHHGGWTNTVIPQTQLEWLQEQLQATEGAVILTHQNLDTRDEKDLHMVRNAAQVRKMLEDSGKVRYVFQGHCHSGGYSKINSIEYFTLKAMCEGDELNWCTAAIRAWNDITVTMHWRAFDAG